MCLFTKRVFPKIATKDIVCYKLIINIGGKYTTPYRGTVIKDEVIKGKIPFFASGLLPKPSKQDYCETRKVENGYIHTCGEYGFAKQLFYQISATKKNTYLGLYSSVEVYRCIIPKGTLYFENDKAFPNLEYASREIVFKEKMEL